MSSYGSRKSSADPLQKRIPRNPKFEHIQSTVDSGDSISRQMQRIERKGENVKVKPNELYRRMKVTTFVQLIIQVTDHDDDDDDIHPTNSATGEPFRGIDYNQRPPTADTERGVDDEILALYGKKSNQNLNQDPQFKSVVVGVGEMDLHKPPIPRSLWHWSYDSPCPYLLLDVRPPEDYEKFHMVTAFNYPSAMLARSVNYETKELLAYRNKPGRLIILYDDEEHVSPMVARTLCERGYDNIFLLTGGMKLAYRLFPKGLLTPGGADDPKGFDRECVTILENQLDDIFNGNNTIGSRLSRHSTAASRSASSQAVTSRMTPSARVAAGRPPFKPP